MTGYIRAQVLVRLLTLLSRLALTNLSVLERVHLSDMCDIRPIPN